MNRSIMLACAVVATLAGSEWGCSSNGGPPSDGATAGTMFQISKGDGGKDAEGDAAPSRDANVGLTAARMTAIRACIAGRWGTTVLRAAIDVAADFDGCTTPAENSGDVGDSNFALVLDGWAEPEDEDHSRMHRLVTGDQ